MSIGSFFGTFDYSIYIGWGNNNLIIYYSSRCRDLCCVRSGCWSDGVVFFYIFCCKIQKKRCRIHCAFGGFFNYFFVYSGNLVGCVSSSCAYVLWFIIVIFHQPTSKKQVFWMPFVIPVLPNRKGGVCEIKCIDNAVIAWYNKIKITDIKKICDFFVKNKNFLSNLGYFFRVTYIEGNNRTFSR